MKMKRHDSMTPHEIVDMVLARKAASKANTIANMTGKPSKRDPWRSGIHTSIVWLLLDEIYLWTLHNDTSHPQTYRRLADDLVGYDCRTKRSWTRALDWVKAHGDPRKNKRWVLWRDSLDMGRS